MITVTILETLAVFVGIPVLIYGLIAVLTLIPGRAKGRKPEYRPGSDRGSTRPSGGRATSPWCPPEPPREQGRRGVAHMAHGDFSKGEIEAMGPVAVKYWNPQVGPAGGSTNR